MLITGKYFVNLQVKGSPVRHVLPSTGMAAHAIDDLNEAIELEDRHESIDALLENDADDKTRSPAIPLQPPPVVQNAYEQVIKFSPFQKKILDLLTCTVSGMELDSAFCL